MSLQVKIVLLRKQKGWSQEELAYQLDVSRQAVSKWESGSSIPEIDNIVQMSELFNVSLDYLLKGSDDDLATNDSKIATKVVSKEEARKFIDLTKRMIWKIAIGVMLCILSPIPLIVLAGLSEEPYAYVSNQVANVIGICVLLLLIAIAVLIFIFGDMKLSKYQYLKKEKIMLNSDTLQMVSKEKEAFQPKYVAAVSIATVLCIISILPLIVFACITEDSFLHIIGVCIFLFLIAVAVFLYVVFGEIHSAFSKLLQEGDYSIEKKKHINEPFAAIYWSIVVAIYLITSFCLKQWDTTWIIWPVAGVMYFGINSVVVFIADRKK